MKPTLLVLAAGMGSRYGGLKQIDPIGPNGETILEYSVFDALRAGFGRVVFVIRRDIEPAFREAVGQKFEGRVAVDYAFQDLRDVPAGFETPAARAKPWGTAHAIYCARSVVKEPFASINADDFYGAGSYQLIGDHLRAARDEGGGDYAMVGFPLGLTLSEFGPVARGICARDTQGCLVDVVECTRIERDGDGIKHTDDRGKVHPLPGDAVASMNFWGFTPSVFGHLEQGLTRFLREKGDDPKSEFYIPTAVQHLVAEGRARVRVLTGRDCWFGITYQADRPQVVASLRALVERGAYPSPLDH